MKNELGREVVAMLFEIIGGELAETGECHLPGIGRFIVRAVPARGCVSKGETVVFKPSKKLKRKIGEKP